MSLEDDAPLNPPPSQGLGLVTAACLLAFGIGIAGFFIGQHAENGLVQLHGAHVVSVKGLAERAVKADLALWPMRFVATGGDLGAVQTKIDADTKAIMAFLKNEGLPDDAVTIERTDVVDLLARAYRNGNDHDNRFILYGNIMIRSADVDLVQRISGKTGDLVKLGVVFTTEGAAGASAALSPYFLFTHLNDVKLDMLAEATRNARGAAMQFAQDANVPLGALVKANQGVFAILPGDPYPAAQEETQIDKIVRVVTSVDYAIGP